MQPSGLDTPDAIEPSTELRVPWRKRWLAAESLRRRLLLGMALYLFCTAVFFVSAAPNRVVDHTPYNHYALLADSWLHGRLDMRGPPPPYAAGNDFAQKGGKWFVSFPPFPAVWLVPWVAMAGAVENVRDGQAFLWLAGIGPAGLWLVLERLRQRGYSERSERTNFLLSLLFAFGTVYWFTAVQGTVWFAAHVVAVALGAFILLASIEARSPIAAGLLLGCAFLTRPPMAAMGLLFVAEAFRMSLRDGFPAVRGGRLARVYETVRALAWKPFLWKLTLFAIPLLTVVALALWHNYARFGNPFEFGHEHLTIAWRARIAKWGLFSYHYLARNLSIVLAGLPFITKTPPGLQINHHGLALWITSPVFLWLLWPKKAGWLVTILALTAAAVALPNLLYQNSGWMQFGYRFSNDFALILIVLIALGGRRLGSLFCSAAIIAIAINAVGALTFDRARFSRLYFSDSSQQILFQPD